MGKTTWLLFAVLCLGCATTQWDRARADGPEGDLVVERARRDMRCSLVTIVHLGGDNFGADGCGQQAVYQVICNPGDGAQSPCFAALHDRLR